jgi:hypothetical protein
MINSFFLSSPLKVPWVSVAITAHRAEAAGLAPGGGGGWGGGGGSGGASGGVGWGVWS